MKSATLIDWWSWLRESARDNKLNLMYLNFHKYWNCVLKFLSGSKRVDATQYELSSKINEKRLDAAIQRLNKGDFLKKKLIKD